MTALAAEFFTLDKVNRLKIIQDVIDRSLTTLMAAQRLGISDRQCRRLPARYREDGPLGMTSRRCGKASNHQLPQGLAAYALNMLQDRLVKELRLRGISSVDAANHLLMSLWRSTTGEFAIAKLTEPAV